MFSLCRCCSYTQKVIKSTAISAHHVTNFILSNNVHISQCSMRMTQSQSMLEMIYSVEDQHKILQVLNEDNPSELQARKVTRVVINALPLARPLKSISDIMKLPKMDIVKAQKLCQATLMPMEELMIKVSKSNQRILNPVLSKHLATNITTVTSVDLDASAAVCVTMDSNLHFLDSVSISVGSDKQTLNIFRYDHHVFNEEVKTLITKLPKSDIYLLRQRSTPKGNNHKVLAVHYGRLLLDATFFSLMSANNCYKVFEMSEAYTQEAFSLKVGNERVSCVPQVDQIMLLKTWDKLIIENMDVFKIKLDLIGKAELKERAGLCFLQTLLFIAKILIPLRNSEQE